MKELNLILEISFLVIFLHGISSLPIETSFHINVDHTPQAQIDQSQLQQQPQVQQMEIRMDGEHSSFCDLQHPCKESLECIDNRCLCSSPLHRMYDYQNHICVSLVASTCTTDTDCTSNSECVSSMCTCKLHYSANSKLMCQLNYAMPCLANTCNGDLGLACKYSTEGNSQCLCLDSGYIFNEKTNRCEDPQVYLSMAIEQQLSSGEEHQTEQRVLSQQQQQQQQSSLATDIASLFGNNNLKSSSPSLLSLAGLNLNGTVGSGLGITRDNRAALLGALNPLNLVGEALLHNFLSGPFQNMPYYGNYNPIGFPSLFSPMQQFNPLRKLTYIATLPIRAIYGLAKVPYNIATYPLRKAGRVLSDVLFG